MRQVYVSLFDNYREDIGNHHLLSREEENQFGKAIQKSRKDITTYLLQTSPETIEQFCTQVPKRNLRRSKIAKEYTDFLSSLNLPTLVEIEPKDYDKVDKFLSREDPRFYFPKIIEKYKLQLEQILQNEEASQERDEAERSKEEVEQLEIKWQQAINQLVTANLPLVISIAKRYARRGIQFGDIVSEGNLGLIRAATYFEAERGYKFSVYATPWIHAEMQRLTRREKHHSLPSLDEKISEDDETDYYNTHPDLKLVNPIDYIDNLRSLQNIAATVAGVCDRRKNAIRDVGIVYLAMGIVNPEQDKDGNKIHPSIKINREGKIIPPSIHQKVIDETRPYSSDEIAVVYEMTRQNVERILDLVAEKMVEQSLPPEIEQIGNLDLRKYKNELKPIQ